MSAPREPAAHELTALLRHLTPPVCAVTTAARGRRNGFIVNSAQRASLVPAHPRLSFYCSKPNLSHDLVLDSGLFTIHLLRRDQWDVIAGLGLRSGRDADKLDGLATFDGATGCPVLADCVAAFECRVANIMDAGGATFVLGDVVRVHAVDASAPVMTSEHFRAHAPDELRRSYEERLAYAQELLRPLSERVDTGVRWRG
jgi:flavin reductase (DIM6/NTAB) family NADH-FMN oxidoreductase RutF